MTGITGPIRARFKPQTISLHVSNWVLEAQSSQLPFISGVGLRKTRDAS